MAIIDQYAGLDYKRARLADTRRWDKTPQYTQDRANCWLYSMFNNAYFTLGYRLSSREIEEIKNEMQALGININEGGGSLISGAFIARYLSNKLKKKIRCFNIDALRANFDFAKMAIERGYCFEFARMDSPLFYADLDVDGVLDQVHASAQATGWHSTNVRFEKERMQFEELGTWGSSKYNRFFYDMKQFVANMKT